MVRDRRAVGFSFGFPFGSRAILTLSRDTIPFSRKFYAHASFLSYTCYEIQFRLTARSVRTLLQALSPKTRNVRTTLESGDEL